tara:strand:- start:16 stop:1170 length:1155 start_codon:yes stop_codon:yes gene_type:complete
MTVRVNKPSFNIREKLSELGRKFGLKGSELAAAETVQEAREIVSAGRKNMIINGACMINQRFGSGTYTLSQGNNYYPVDRFRAWASGGGQFTIQRSDNAPPGFKNSLMFTVLTEDSSIAAGDYYMVQQRVEGINFAHLNWGTSDAKPITLSFWVRATVTGKYGISFFPNGQVYNYVTHYNINNADAWEYKTITIPGATSGTWLTNDSIGFGIWWDFGSGTLYGTSTTETWGQNGKFWPTGSTQMIATNGATFRMTGVQLEVGKNATEFEHRSYGEELALCQRYFWIVQNARWLMGYKRHDSYVYFQLDTPVPMRASPTPTITSVGLFTNHQSTLGGAVQTTGTSVFEYRPDSGRGTLQISSTYSGTHETIPSWEAGTIEFDAEI